MPGDSVLKLQLWKAKTAVADLPHDPLPGCAEPDEAELLACKETWRSPSSRKRTELEPFCREWFEWIEHRRYARQGRWLTQRMEFRRRAGDKILCLGHDLGTDWVQYALNDAQVTVLHPSTEQLNLVRRNFEARNIPAQFIHGTFTALPQREHSMDVVCVSALGGAIEDLPKIIPEIYRVLRPGGKLISILPAHYSVARWQEICFAGLRRFRSPTGDESFSARQLRRMFEAFSEHRIYKRHLRRSDLPHLWRWIPLPVMERWMGKYLLLKAFKPLSSALTSVAAA